jgi:predicted NUDIX family phosphoesterase
VVDELVYVVARDLALSDGAWHGLRRDVDLGEVARLESVGEFRSRAAVEPDPRLKQLIPYLVLRDGPRWFLMRRTQAGGDERLHDRFSLGLGGHMNPGDDGVVGGLEREWSEEVDADFAPAFRLVGLLNDDTTAVGAVHLGVVFEADAAGRAVAIRETDKLSAEWASGDVVRTIHDRLETWSQLVFDALSAGAILDGS